MKKIILFILLLTTAIGVRAFSVLNTSTGVISEKDIITPPERIVENLKNGTKVTYIVSEVLLAPDPIFAGTWHPLLEQFSLTATEREAWLPIKSERITCPDSFSNELQILEDDYIDIVLTISPARPISVNGTDLIESSENIPPITLSNSFTPYNIAELGSTAIYRGNAFQSIVVSPIQYNSETKTMRIHRKFSYLLSSFAPTADAENIGAYERIPDPISKNLDLRVEKPQFISSERITPAPISYLMLAPLSLQEWATELHYWKQHMGYDVVLDIRDNWTTTSIKERISEFYNSRTDAYYVLLIGDNDLMPSMLVKSPLDNKYLYSDMYYACMDGPDDTMPDLIYGRIPATTSNELAAVVKKIMQYEQNPNNGNSKTSFMAAAYFQDYNTDGYEDVYFTRTAETVCSSLESVFDNVKRVYCHTPNAKPTAWNKNTVGFTFPESLKKNEAWGGTKSDIIAAINGGCNMVLHRDHGTTSGWADPSFSTTDLVHLNNSVYPIVFNINCHSGNFTANDNFSKKLLCMAASGASAVIGSTTTSYSELNDVLSLAMMNSIWPDKSFKYYNTTGQFNNTFKTPSYSIGEVLQIGLSKMEEAFPQYPKYATHERLEFHCLGDPSLYIYWGAESNLEESLNISYKDGYVTVSIPGNQDYYISFWEAYSKRKQRTYGNYATFQTDFPDETSVYIYKNGIKPIHQYSNYPYPPKRSIAEQPAISNISFNNNEVNIELEGDSNGTMLIVGEADNLLTSKPYFYNPEEPYVTHQIQNPGCRFFIVSLNHNGELLQSKTIYKK